jgi:hypothetical protein
MIARFDLPVNVPNYQRVIAAVLANVGDLVAFLTMAGGKEFILLFHRLLGAAMLAIELLVNSVTGVHEWLCRLDAFIERVQLHFTLPRARCAAMMCGLPANS